jgi:hypothetical protein
LAGGYALADDSAFILPYPLRRVLPFLRFAFQIVMGGVYGSLLRIRKFLYSWQLSTTPSAVRGGGEPAVNRPGGCLSCTTPALVFPFACNTHEKVGRFFHQPSRALHDLWEKESLLQLCLKGIFWGI